jgi:hypothetical protein
MKNKITSWIIVGIILATGFGTMMYFVPSIAQLQLDQEAAAIKAVTNTKVATPSKPTPIVCATPITVTLQLGKRNAQVITLQKFLESRPNHSSSQNRTRLSGQGKQLLWPGYQGCCCEIPEEIQDFSNLRS